MFEIQSDRRQYRVPDLFCILSLHNEYCYTEHCSVGPTKLIETTIASTTTARMKISDDEDF